MKHDGRKLSWEASVYFRLSNFQSEEENQNVYAS